MSSVHRDVLFALAAAGFALVGAGLSVVFAEQIPILIGWLSIALGVVFFLGVGAVWAHSEGYMRNWPVLDSLDQWPDFEVYDKHDSFTLREAACLAYDIRPRNRMPRKAVSLYERWQNEYLSSQQDRLNVKLGIDNVISNALQQTGLDVEHPEYLFHPELAVSKQELTDWFKRQNWHPRFLFPYKRGER